MPELRISLSDESNQEGVDYLMSEAVKEDFDYPEVSVTNMYPLLEFFIRPQIELWAGISHKSYTGRRDINCQV